MRILRRIVALAATAAFFTGAVALARPAAASETFYVHMNGTNDFLEPTLAVAPGDTIVFVNEDTGSHTIVGFDPQTGTISTLINGEVEGTPGPGHPVHTYTLRLTRPGIYEYYCSVHAVLAKTFGSYVAPAHKPGVDGFAGAMAGEIIVTTDQNLLGRNPSTSNKRELTSFFGG